MDGSEKADDSHDLQTDSFPYWKSYGRALIWVAARLLVIAAILFIILALLGPALCNVVSNLPHAT